MFNARVFYARGFCVCVYIVRECLLCVCLFRSSCVFLLIVITSVSDFCV